MFHVDLPCSVYNVLRILVVCAVPIVGCVLVVFKALSAIRVRKVPDTASAAVAAAAEPESAKQLSANTAAIRKWVSRHKYVAKLPATMPVGPKGQVAWITTCALELARLVSGKPYPSAYLTSERVG